MDTIVFSHANGFPAKTYAYLFEFLKPYPIQYINKIGHGHYKVEKDWQPLADELISFAENLNKPLVGIGHSVGGVAILYAATKRKDLFRKIILLDPPLVPGGYRKYLLAFAKKTGLVGNLLPIAKKTKTRRREFSSKAEALAYFKSKKLFELFHSNCLKDYIEEGLVYNSNKNCYELAFSADIEYAIFCTSPDIYPFATGIDIPITLIYSNGIASQDDINWYKRRFPHVQIIDFKAGHMFPFEQPQKTAELIKNSL